LTDTQLDAAGAYVDRTWIKAVQWELRDAERRMRLSEWVETVRKEIRIAPAYLTGINWRWLEAVLRELRLRPFLGNPSALYVLLLMQIEERNHRAEALVLSAEFFAKGKNLKEFISWLIVTFDVEAIAFVRYLLDTDTILRLGLAPNLTAALAGRIYALQRCVKQFRYTELLSKELFAQEWETLNSSLLLTSVNAGQFEIPWDVFQKDAAAKHLDLYTAVRSLQPPEDLSPVLSEAKITVPLRFRNGKITIYSYANHLSPMASLIVSVIEDFLDHPGFGLEIILSTRFRHDTMRREFVAVLVDVADAHIESVFKTHVRAIVEEVERPVLDEIDAWLDTYMHTNRPGRPDGLFDVIPSPEELKVILTSVKASDGLANIIGYVTQWIRGRLEAQLPGARIKFETEMAARFGDRLSAERERLVGSSQYRSYDVDKVLSAIGTALQHRVAELGEWFRGNPGVARPPMAFHELKMAADGLFEAYRSRRGYRSYFACEVARDPLLPPDKTRLCFDLLREVFAGALKYCGSRQARIRITYWATASEAGFRFSNLVGSERVGTVSREATIPGDPYKSLDDVIFREGDSGLAKIASLAASLLGRRATLRVCERRGSFHLFVPIWPCE
jgi:hypothetical protein